MWSPGHLKTLLIPVPCLASGHAESIHLHVYMFTEALSSHGLTKMRCD